MYKVEQLTFKLVVIFSQTLRYALTCDCTKDEKRGIDFAKVKFSPKYKV